jgi:tRNA dimethylallyltransferase
MGGTLYVITGCTAVGKTAYALDFARRHDGEIISCDSIAVYRHVDIGSAKPTAAERKEIKHHCLDLVDPSEDFDVSLFIAAAQGALGAVAKAGKAAVVVGGSGFYLKSFYQPVVDGVAIPPEVEKFVADVQTSSGLDGLVSMLISANDGLCPNVDIKNPRRVMAALKRSLASGRTPDAILGDFRAQPPPFPGWRRHTILLEREWSSMEGRVRRRVGQMFADGLVAEVEFLLSAHGKLGNGVKNAIGYREIIHWLESGRKKSVPALVDDVVHSTMKLVKKQRTWFRTQIPVDERILLSWDGGR